MDFLLGIAIIVGVSCVGGALVELAKNIGKGKGFSGRDAKQILAELKALRAEMAELRGTGKAAGGAGPDIVSRLDRLQTEMTALRDTTTEFDMSVDAAIDRLERRLERVEERAAVPAAGTEAPQMLSRK